jgi:cytochrome P450
MIRSQSLTLFVAGHETTATALAWTWYLLAHNPEAEARMHEELDRVLADRSPTAADVPQLPYTEMVFAEAMRLYPPIYAMARKAIQEHALGGFTFPPGTLFLVSQYVMQRDPRYFPDPERFDPERMSHEARAKLPRFAYFPFGGGPRQCIGEAFAWLEGVLILAALGRHWRFRWTSDRPADTVKIATLQPKGGLPMVLERRRA